MFDVIVVGARCAGAPAAMQFARSGHRVLMVDQSAFPADKLSTLYIQQSGVLQLQRWGLLDAVRATGCPPLGHVVYQLGDDIRVEGCADPVDGVTAAYAPRRSILDRILVEAAVDAGVEFRDGCAVTGLVEEDGRVRGVRLAADGVQSVERARLVVGADGMRSTVAELTGAPKTVEHPKLTCAYYTFWKGPKTHFELYEGPTGWVSAVPTNDAVLISAYYPQQRFTEVRTRAQEAYLENIRDNAPGLYAKLEDAEQVDRLYGTGDQQNFFRQAHGPGWALIGDAGHHKDSLTARGIGDAFAQAQMLVDRVGDSLGSDEALDVALKDFAEERDLTFMENYRATLLVAEASARDKRRMLLKAVSSSPDHVRRYFNTVAGLRPVSELYTPELLALLKP
ncbi:NAD(P)/FAD-dependent oxidoreductase [Streptomyces sp. Wb2n-11]|uniref:NAD(P)/FAD-dependent oxidoreductase n=1 Tax=Streptomyces sp. Wb2n-11 TaxID=1030533 RepID=UPI000A7B0C2E|nr:NAD(P)/FAD-dependent oxidoreductase [Streptomyces sp. Wb2n-11]